MNKQEKKNINKNFNDNMKTETIFIIRRRPLLKVANNGKGMELNEGYDYELNSALPELADAIAKFAIELPKQGIGKDSDKYFIQLINNYFSRLVDRR